MDYLIEAATSNTSSITYENGPLPYEEFPRSEEPVYILGEKYSTLYDLTELKHDLLSRLWFTYRRNYASIGGDGPTSDNGWGCTLRCGQMMLGQALICRHLGRGWRWLPDKICASDDYWSILKMFQDKKGSCYSIHQIASMGASEGKAVGQWFGPNTISQVLKKLAVYDDLSNLVLHVALDNTVIEQNVRILCKCGSSVDKIPDETTQTGHINGPILDQTVNPEVWKPLLLIIPLRLGLSDVNPIYFNSLKTCLSFRQSVGIIGGKPNHAHWFTGYVGDELIYLDPHTTQLTVDLDKSASDESFHCPYASRMKITQLDPSIAVGFYCGTEAEFDDWCISIKKFISAEKSATLFELHKSRPTHWPSMDTAMSAMNYIPEYVAASSNCDSDEDFELIG